MLLPIALWDSRDCRKEVPRKAVTLGKWILLKNLKCAGNNVLKTDLLFHHDAVVFSLPRLEWSSPQLVTLDGGIGLPIRFPHIDTCNVLE